MIERPWNIGLGWRPQTAQLIACRSARGMAERAAVPADLGFVEVIAETVGPEPPPALVNLVRAGVPVIPHGIGLSLGSAEGVDPARIDRLARVCEQLQAPLVSEHIAFVRANGVEAGHLLPVRRSRAMLDVLVDNVRRAQSVLPVPLVLENIAMLFEYPDQELSEADFIVELLDRTGVSLLLDLANLFANARNHGWDAGEFLNRVPVDRVAYCHVAGGVVKGDLYHDTHAHPTPDGVAELVTEVRSRAAVPILLERDSSFGTRQSLEAELDGLAAAARLGDERRLAGGLDRVA